MSMIKIATVIPVGPGHEHAAQRAAASAVRQTVRTMPIVVNDTGRRWHVDGALNVSTRLARTGVGNARRLGLDYAHGAGFDMVIYLDADDILMPRAVEAMLRTFAARRPAYVYGDGYNYHNPTKINYFRTPEYDRLYYGRANLHNVTALLPIDVARRGLWTNHDWEDYLYYASLSLAGLCGARAPYPIIVYRMDLGERRKIATARGDQYAIGLTAAYRAALEKGTIMGCCGYDGPLTASADQVLINLANEPLPDGMVAMSYAGPEQGWVSYKVNGREYRARLGATVAVKQEDVAALLTFDRWFLTPPAAQPTDVPAAITTIENDVAAGAFALAGEAFDQAAQPADNTPSEPEISEGPPEPIYPSEPAPLADQPAQRRRRASQ